MTTFQYIIDAIISALNQIIPISSALRKDIFENLLQWQASSTELLLLVTLVGSFVFLIFFRYDWLGIISAFLKSIFRLASLKSENRNLDQQILIFMMMVCVPSILVKQLGQTYFHEHEWFNHAFVNAGILLALAGGLQFAANWNKRIKGLNHLKLVDGIAVAALSCLSVHAAIPLAAVLWIGFAVNNYHYEAIFKYSMLILGVHLIAFFFNLLQHSTIGNAFETVGALNSIAVLVLVFTTFWVVLEQLQKNLGEHTLKSFKWFSIMSAIFYIALYFVKA